MPTQLQKGEPALYKYNKIRYSFVPIQAGEQQVLTSDPWAFLNSFLLQKLSGSRGANKQRIERAIYYSGLAEDFYKAAEVAPLPSKGALLYYGMLDLVKCFLSLNDIPLETKHEHHGLVLPLGAEQTVDVKGSIRNSVNIFFEFSKLLGKPISNPIQVKFEQALSHIPEIHSIYTSVGYGKKRKLLPVDIEFQVNPAKDKIFTEVVFQKEQEAKVDTSKFLKGKRKDYFRDGFPRDHRAVYRAKRRKSFDNDNIHRIYANVLTEYQKLDIVPILTSRGYRYYVDLRPGDLPQLSYSLLAMFYLGSAARYRPLEVKKLMEGEVRPLVSEFVSLTPRQFLYQMISQITKKECVIPFAQI